MSVYDAKAEDVVEVTTSYLINFVGPWRAIYIRIEWSWSWAPNKKYNRSYVNVVSDLEGTLYIRPRFAGDREALRQGSLIVCSE